jgi:hypothetical protein
LLSVTGSRNYTLFIFPWFFRTEKVTVAIFLSRIWHMTRNYGILALPTAGYAITITTWTLETLPEKNPFYLLAPPHLESRILH